jgi:hypothetical protein
MSSPEILSVAIFEPLPGKERDALATLRDLFAALAAGAYSRDSLYRDGRSCHCLLFRYWKSESARRAAQEDPEVLRCWAKLAHEIQTFQVYESLDEIALLVSKD